MKQFVVRAYDGERMLDKRMEVRPRHLEEQPEPKDKWKPENVSYNEFGGKAE
jgi:hypothetical protein